MNELNPLSEKHTRLASATFFSKIWGLVLLRSFKNIIEPVRRFGFDSHFNASPIVATSESELWNEEDDDLNRILTAGKIQNLRIGAKKLNGIEVPANEVFSFWRHMGNPNFGKGFVIGRELREGCIIPTLGGGLCQLSNAMYDAALKAGFETVERHGHTRVIKGSFAEQNRDATVKWNYVDLRFKSLHPFRIEVELTADKLTLLLKSEAKNEVGPVNLRQIRSAVLNDCYSCGNLDCARHPDERRLLTEKSVTAYILDERWAEYESYVNRITTSNDIFILPVTSDSDFKPSGLLWEIDNSAKVKTLPFTTFKRSILFRLLAKTNNIFALTLRLDKLTAKAAAGLIPLEANHLVVSQNLLPFLWEEGVFGGRTFDVLMTRLPIERLHERLDFAHSQFPESKTLNDFRAPQTIVDLENAALTKSRHIVTPHTEIEAIFNNKSIKLDWKMPEFKTAGQRSGERILFPASGLGRKGAHLVKQLAYELDVTLVVAGKALESEDFWNGIKIEAPKQGNIFEGIGLVVYPAYVEHQPRLLLKAIAAGIPVITTAAAGISASDNVAVVPIGDYKELKQAVIKQMQSVKNILSPSISG